VIWFGTEVKRADHSKAGGFTTSGDASSLRVSFSTTRVFA
jgi:hypothetical protein